VLYTGARGVVMVARTLPMSILTVLLIFCGIPMTDDMRGDNPKDRLSIPDEPTRSPEEEARRRGFDPGEDDELQHAILKNLKEAHGQHTARGADDAALNVAEDITALERLIAVDAVDDPDDTRPDNALA